MKLGLIFHVKSLVNNCWPRIQKSPWKPKVHQKTCFFDDVDKMMGVIWNMGLLNITHCLKHF